MTVHEGPKRTESPTSRYFSSRAKPSDSAAHRVSHDGMRSRLSEFATAYRRICNTDHLPAQPHPVLLAGRTAVNYVYPVTHSHKNP